MRWNSVKAHGLNFENVNYLLKCFLTILIIFINMNKPCEYIYIQISITTMSKKYESNVKRYLLYRKYYIDRRYVIIVLVLNWFVCNKSVWNFTKKLIITSSIKSLTYKENIKFLLSLAKHILKTVYNHNKYLNND